MSIVRKTGIAVTAGRNFVCCSSFYSKLYQVLRSVLRCFPEFPYAHPQAYTYSCIKILTKPLHTTDFEVVYPTSYQLIQLHYFVAVAYSPTAVSKFLHSFLELCYWFCMRLCFVLMCTNIEVESKSEVFYIKYYSSINRNSHKNISYE